MGKSEIPVFSDISHNSVIYARFPKSARITSYRPGKSLVVTSLYQHRSISTFKKFSLWENLRFLYFPTFSIILSFSSDMTIIDLSTQDFEKNLIDDGSRKKKNVSGIGSKPFIQSLLVFWDTFDISQKKLKNVEFSILNLH